MKKETRVEKETRLDKEVGTKHYLNIVSKLIKTTVSKFVNIHSEKKFETTKIVQEEHKDLLAKLEAEKTRAIKNINREYLPLIKKLKADIALREQMLVPASIRFCERENVRSMNLGITTIKCKVNHKAKFDDKKELDEIKIKLEKLQEKITGDSDDLNLVITKRFVSKEAIKIAYNAGLVTKEDLLECGVDIVEYDSARITIGEAYKTDGSVNEKVVDPNETK